MLAPGVVAFDEEAILARHGRQALFTRDSVVFDGLRCKSPSFSRRTVPADSFFNIGFLTTAKDAKIRPDPDNRLRITKIRCAGVPGEGAMQEVIWSGNDTISIVEGGVFFILERNR